MTDFESLPDATDNDVADYRTLVELYFLMAETVSKTPRPKQLMLKQLLVSYTASKHDYLIFSQQSNSQL